MNIKAATVCLTLGWVLQSFAHAATIVISNTNDSGSGSLREALAAANNGDTIDATGVSGVITLTTGELLVDKSVTITGPGADLLAVDGNAATAVFHVTAIGSVTIADLTIRNAHGDQNGFGGGIINAGATLTITNSEISGNTAGYGAGVYNAGTLTIVNSTVIGNIGPTIVGGSRGGGAYNVGILAIVSSTVSNNMATASAALYNERNATLTISNSTISGNAAGDYGGVTLNVGTLQIFDSTLSNNSAPFVASGIVNVGTIQIADTILNSDTPGSIIFNSGTISSLGYNLSSDDAAGVLTGPGDQINTDPMLGPLQNNGGTTFTHELLPGSPAINAGNPGFTPPPLFDQRGPGFDREVNNRIDIGSFEVQVSTPTATPSITPTVTPTATITPAQTPRPVPTPRPRRTPAPRPASGR